MKRLSRRAGALAVVAVGLLGGSAAIVTGAGAAPKTPGVTPRTITVGLITPETGPGASNFTGVVPAAEARIDLQNAHGGVDGRRINLVIKDDATNPATNQSATAALISEGVFGIMDVSPVAFGGYKLAQQAGVPVTGGATDAEEWYQKPNTNMFSITGQLSPKDPQYGGLASFIRAHGGTRCGSVGYSISPSSTAAARGFILQCERAGLKNAYLNTTLPFGTIDTTSLALEMKGARVNALYLPLDSNTNFAIVTSLKQAGVNMKMVISATGYGQEILDDQAALPDAQGTWFTVEGTPVEVHTPATEQFQAALARYVHFTGIPGFSWYEGWGAADLMIYGLERAGKNPTQPGFINALHKVTHYDVGGLESAQPANYTLSHWGKAPKQLCQWLVQLKGRSFVNPTKICGKLLANSNELPNQ